jgi:threonine dehydratase
MIQKILKNIEDNTVYEIAKKTPNSFFSTISQQTNNSIYLKREDKQDVFSFKIRGAYKKISSLSAAIQQKGIIAASAGNHAQGVAISAKKLKIKAIIVMPATTPKIKVEAVKSYGAKVILMGDCYDDAYDYAIQLAKDKKLTFIHPYDDIEVISGQATIAKEITEDFDKIDYCFIPVGGGGLLAGMTTYLKEKMPNTKIIAVEPENSACFEKAFKQRKRVKLDQVGIFADGVAVKQIGKIPFELTKNKVDDCILVTTDEICAAIKDIYDETRAIAEPAGGLSLAGIKKYIEQKKIKNKICIGLLCGANINFHRLRHISERAEIGEKHEALFAIEIPEEKGSFLSFCKLLQNRFVTEFNYRYNTSEKAHIFVGIQLNDNEKPSDLINYFNEHNYNALDLSSNEMAKLHIRYMVGGKSKLITNEKLYRFQFPERPKALLNFLSKLGSIFNISLFHYRNHGAAYGRILIGIQIQEEKLDLFKNLLTEINYVYFDETNNPAYKLFL